MGIVRDPWERFWERVYEAEDLSENGWEGCWLWAGEVTTGGYGRMSTGPAGAQVAKRVHRIAYEYVVGIIPDGMVLDHLCRRRLCVNPAHLEVVSHRINLLRGEGLPAQNARKTHCHAGHPLEGDNLSSYGLKIGERRCLACARARNKAYAREAGGNVRHLRSTG